MADNATVDPGTNPSLPVATDQVTYSGEDAHVQLFRQVGVTGAEGSKTVVDVPVDATYGMGVDVKRIPTVTVTGTVTSTPSGTQTTKETKASTGTTTQKADSVSSGELLAANANRLGGTIYNDSTATLYVLWGTGTASSTNFSLKLFSQGYGDIPANYTGAVTGIWSSDDGGFAYFTELT